MQPGSTADASRAPRQCAARPERSRFPRPQHALEGGLGRAVSIPQLAFRVSRLQIGSSTLPGQIQLGSARKEVTTMDPVKELLTDRRSGRPGLFVPALPTLWPRMLFSQRVAPSCFPFNALQLRFFYFARNAVWLAAKLLN